MSSFSDDELDYLRGGDRRLARIATVGADGTPHVAPVGYSYNATEDTIDVSGRNFAASKKYQDVRRTRRAAIVIDDVLPPWQPRGVEIRGQADAITDPEPLIRIHPQRIISWGIHHDRIGELNARSIPKGAS